MSSQAEHRSTMRRTPCVTSAIHQLPDIRLRARHKERLYILWHTACGCGTCKQQLKAGGDALAGSVRRCSHHLE
jgi:hypothetical protein